MILTFNRNKGINKKNNINEIKRNSFRGATCLMKWGNYETQFQK